MEMGFDWLWLLSVWQTGPAAQRISRSSAAWRHEFEQTLPDLREADIAGSGFAITRYSVHRDLGGDEALARLRTRARQRGLRLMLDLVPPRITRGPTSTRTISSMAARRIWSVRPATIAAWQRRTDRCCLPTAGTHISTAGQTLCSSTTAIRTCSKR
ncbi:alpha-amylase family protein [Cupriavidus necator]